jgi:hypothetical protein
MGDTGTHEIAEAAEACNEATRWTGSRSPASGGRAMSVDWTTTDACERCDEHSSGEAARGPHRAWHAVVAALMEAVRIPQLVGWLARRLEAEAGIESPAAPEPDPLAGRLPLQVEYGLVWDDIGSTDTFPTLEQARAAARGLDEPAQVVRIETWPVADEGRV